MDSEHTEQASQSKTVEDVGDFKLVGSKRKRKQEAETIVRDELKTDNQDDDDDEYEDVEMDDDDGNQENTQSPDKRPKFPPVAGEKSKVLEVDAYIHSPKDRFELFFVGLKEWKKRNAQNIRTEKSLQPVERQLGQDRDANR
jgi:hypothetical protein